MRPTDPASTTSSEASNTSSAADSVLLRQLLRSVAIALSFALAASVGAPLAAASLPAKSAADPADRSLSGRARLEALVDRIKREQGELDSLEAQFVQVQESSMLVEPEESTGTFFYVAPDRVRWEYATPSPISVVIDGESMTTWYRDLDRAERLEIGRYSNQVFKYLGASGAVEQLMDYFTVRVRFPDEEGAPYALMLTPRYQRIARRLASMEIWIDSKIYLPVRVRYVAADGDSTEYRFDDMKVNGEIPSARFDLEMPDSTVVQQIEVGRSE